MQCSNCQFQNMPGVQNCGRCGASLQLASLAIDVHPPRASRPAKWRRHVLPIYWLGRWFPVTRWGLGIRRGLSAMLAHIKESQWRSNLPMIGLVLRTIVPGWAHWYTGRRTRAVCFLACYVGLLLLALLFSRAPASSLMIQAIILFHAATVADALAPTDRVFGQRLLYFVLAYLVLANFVYVLYPIGRFLGR
jgi:hypothetical protein